MGGSHPLMAKSRGRREACFTFTNRSMKNEWEEEVNNYSYKYFGRSTEGETVFDKKTWMAQVCHRHVRMIKSRKC